VLRAKTKKKKLNLDERKTLQKISPTFAHADELGQKV